MKKFLLLSFILLSSACSKPVAEPGNTADAPPSPYAQTEALLDAGGVSYQLIDGAYEIESMKPMIDFFFSMMMAGMQESSPEMINPAILNKLKELPTQAGIDEIVVRGNSTVARKEGGYLTKYSLQHRAGADGWLWKLVGDQIDIAQRIRQLPDTTIMLAHYSMNMPMVFSQTKLELAEFPQALEPMLETEIQLKEMGVPVEIILESFKQGITFAITVNDKVSWSLPIPNLDFAIPETGFVVILPDADREILTFALSMMKTHLPIDFYENEVEGQTVNSLPIPLPVYPPLSLQMLNLDGTTLLATSPDLMKQLILRKEGTRDTPLNASLSGLSSTRASMAIVVDPKIGDYLKAPMEQLFASMQDEDMEEIMGPMLGFYKDMFASIPHVTLNRMEGDVNLSEMLHQRPLSPYYSNNSALTMPAVGGLLAAIAIPSFTKARESAQEMSCINNLRLIESAKDQFAIENNLSSGAEVSEEQVGEYIRNGFPVCPQGGSYSINPIDTFPACSVHGSLE